MSVSDTALIAPLDHDLDIIDVYSVEIPLGNYIRFYGKLYLRFQSISLESGVCPTGWDFNPHGLPEQCFCVPRPPLQALELTHRPKYTIYPAYTNYQWSIFV